MENLNLVNGEYYCEQIASLMRLAVQNCVSHAEQLVQGDHEAVKILMDSLILSGMAMAFAGITRPASGVEHYFSTFGYALLEFHTMITDASSAVSHCTDCGSIRQDQGNHAQRRAGLKYVQDFDLANWHQFVREYLGKRPLS